MFSRGELPRRVDGGADRGAEPLRDPHRPRDGGHRHGAAVGLRRIRLPGQPVRALAAEHVRAVRPGLVALDADAHPQLRPALGPPGAVQAAQQRVVDRVDGRPVRRVRHRHRARAAGSATCSSRATSRAARRSCRRPSRSRRARRVQHRLEQLRAERRRGVAAERAGRLPARAARRSRSGDGARRLRPQLQPRAPRSLHRALR